jgi:alkaline phosphatase
MKVNISKKSMIATALTGLTITSSLIPQVTMAKETKANKSLAKNVIVMISDGWGYNQIAATDYYQYGRIGSQVYENFPFKVGMSTYSINGSYSSESAWNDFNYVTGKPTDSAAAATAMSTGVKTYDAGIGVDINKMPLKHISEHFEEQGKSTGVVTSVEFSHATPAGFVAHNENRNNYSAIANEMILSSKTDVIMGAGNPLYDDDGKLRTAASYSYVGGINTWNGLVNGTLAVSDSDGDGIPDPWKLIQSKEEFINLGNGSTPNRVIGVAQTHTTLQQNRSGDKNADAFKVPFNENVPDLSEMAKGALNVLDNNQNGFFLMIEGGAVDWAGHANQSGRLIEEQADFNKAVEAVNKWVEINSNWGETLLIVTGDHETGYLTGPDSNPDWTSIVNNGAGNMPGMQWNSGNHTNSLVPLFAKGDAARLFKNYADMTDSVKGDYIDNTVISKLIKEVIGY